MVDPVDLMMKFLDDEDSLSADERAFLLVHLSWESVDNPNGIGARAKKANEAKAAKK
jgi:hypothetical protein